MNNFLNVFLSLILYNPLEAMVLLLASWFFKPAKIKRGKFNILDFIIRIYIIGTLNYIVQIPEQFLQDSLWYVYYLFIVGYFLMFLWLKLFGYKNSKLYLTSIILVFNITLDIALLCLKWFGSIFTINNIDLYGLMANMFIRLFQTIIIFILLGVGLMIKRINNYLEKIAKQNLKNTIASTLKGYGEAKLSNKLKEEVKSAK